jgi:hypothetical protein
MLTQLLGLMRKLSQTRYPVYKIERGNQNVAPQRIFPGHFYSGYAL